ncbi:MAG: hypothetical protein HZC02_04385 [Candidatus Levybacteria bacterium]|nr:hypothetical protein [Candidatus Levybacteria bacterium]
MKIINTYKFLLVIIFFSFVFRGLYLNYVPTATNNDQLHYLLDGKSMYVTGKNLAGDRSLFDILMFHYPKNETVQAELPYIFSIITVGPFSFSLAHAAMLSVFLGVGVVILLYFIGKFLINEKFGVILALLASSNPWFISMSRSSYEMISATFFYLLTFFIFQIAKGKYLYLAIPAMLLSFYSYIGTKLIFLPFVAICIVYSYLVLQKKKYKKEFIIIFSFSVLLMAFFFFQLSRQPELSRVNELFLPWNSHVTKNVDHLRHVSLVSPLSSIVDNKYTVYVRTVIANIANVFSPGYLFEYGDYFYSLERYGIFHIIDAAFLIIGCIFFFTKMKKKSVVFLFLIGISILPQIFHDPEGTGNFTPHITLLIPFLLIVIAYGIYFLIELDEVKKYRKVICLFIIGAYLASLLHFSQVYFFHHPLVGNIVSFPNRAVASYISRASQSKKIVAHVSNPQLSVRDYLFYANAMNNKNVSEVSSKLRNKNYVFKNVLFVQCTDEVDERGATVVYESMCNHKTKENGLELAQLRDSAAAYEINNDNLCSRFGQKNFISSVPFRNLHIEAISDKEFCETYVINL